MLTTSTTWPGSRLSPASSALASGPVTAIRSGRMQTLALLAAIARRDRDRERRAGVGRRAGSSRRRARRDAAVKPVGAADEGGDEGGARLHVDLVGRALLLDPAAVHHDDPVGEAHRLVLVVGDDDGGRADGGQDLLQLEAQLLAQLGVERRQRLVEQHQLGPGRQHAGQRHPLLLAAAHLPGPPALEALQLHQPQHLATRPAISALGQRRCFSP